MPTRAKCGPDNSPWMTFRRSIRTKIRDCQNRRWEKDCMNHPTERSSMKTAKWLAVTGFCVLLLGCGKAAKLAALLPDAPAGWSADGGATNRDVSGVGHSSAKSYVPSGNADGMGVKK